jgi:PAS domain S-box-containing protein
MPITSTTTHGETAQTAKILVVEDECILAINLKENLEILGYIVSGIADTGESAIEQAATLNPNLILMDIRLQGGMDGIQAAEHIWDQFQIPVIYVTGHSDKSTVERAATTFPFGYLLKPIREKELYVAIQTALNRYKREQFLSTVLKQMGDAVVVVDAQLRVKYLNRVGESITGWTLDEIRDQQVTETICFVDEYTKQPIEHPLVLALEQQTTVYKNDRTLLVTKDNATLPVADSATPLKDNEGIVTGAVLVFRDDTQRRLIEERNLATERAEDLEVQREQLQRLNQLKDDFLATTSHELRTPLTNIKLAIRLLEITLNQQGLLASELSPQAEVIQRYLTIMQTQCEQELRLVNDLLDMRSLEANAYPLNFMLIDLESWLPDITASFRERAIAQHQSLHIRLPPNLSPIISDEPTLKRITSELVNNACKYTPPGEQIVIAVEVIPDRDSSFLKLLICNSGVEISPDELPKIFEPFYRIPHHDQWNRGGTGLGLALVRKLVECLQGTISVTSAQGWVTFTVQIPLELANDSNN